MRTYLSLILIFFLLQISSQENYHLSMQNGHTLPISCVVNHPNEPIIATGSQDQSIILWNSDTQKQLSSINIATSSVISMEFSQTGEELLILTAKGNVIVYNLSRGEIRTQKKFSSELGYINSVAYSYDPKFVLVGSDRDEQFIWNTTSNQIISSTKGFKTTVSARSLSADLIYRINFEGAKSFQVINGTTSDTSIIPFDKPQNYQFNPKRNIVAVGSTKLIAGVFDISTGELIQQIEPNTENQCDGCNLKVFWSPDGKLLVTYDQKNGLYVWDGNFEKPSFNVDLDERIEYYSFSKNGRFILLSTDKSLWIIDCETKKIKLQFDSKYLADFRSILDNDEKNIYIPGQQFTLQKLNLNGKLTAVFKGSNNQDANQLPFDYLDWYQSGSLKHYKQLMPMEVSHNKGFMLFGKIGKELQKLDLKSGHISTLFKGEKSITCIDISKEDNLLAFGDASGKITLYDLSNNTILKTISVHADMIFDIAFSDNGESIISCGWDGRTYITNIETGTKEFISEGSNAFNNLVTDEQDLYYFKTCLDHSITMYEADSHLEVRKFIGHMDKVNDLFFDSKKGQLFSCSQDGSVRIWNVSSGLLISKYYLDNLTPALSIAKHPSKELLLVGGIDRKLYTIQLENKTSISKPLHSSGIACINFINDNTIGIRGLDGVVKFYNLDIRADLFTLYLYPSNQWLSVDTKSMRFEGTNEAMKQIHLVKDSQTKDIGNLFNQYYSPGLIIRSLNSSSEDVEQGRNIEDIINNSIDFELSIMNNMNEYFRPLEDSISVTHKSIASIQIEFAGNYKYQDIFVYNNNKLVLTESSDEEIAFRGTKQNVIVEVPIVPQKNQIEIKVIDKENIEHTHFPITINYDTIAAKTDLFILSLGINQYQNKNYNLKYAKNDASQFVTSLQKVAGDLYEQVFVLELSDKKVTKENVLSLVNEITSKIGPEDVFVFYYAGHGVMYENENTQDDFFLVMSDITNLYGGREMLLEKGLSSEELLDISKSISAQKQVFFLDACQSGAALNVLATRGVSREKMLAQLARSSGTFFITASQDIEYANESSSLEHGLFTYAILEILTGSAPNYNDNVVSMGELKNYVEQRVPELSEQFKTNPQYPTGYSFGNDFPIGVLNPK